MNIYVDETFFENKTIISAIKISDKKIRQTLFMIKEQGGWKMTDFIKATDVRMKKKKSLIRFTAKTIRNKSKWSISQEFIATQHSDDFYTCYKKFLKDMHNKCPRATIYVDKFNGWEKVAFPYVSFVEQTVNTGVQIAELVDKRK